MRTIAKAALFTMTWMATSSAALAFDREDARFVIDTDDIAVLDYVVCLEREVGKTPRAMSIPDALEVAAQTCAEQWPLDASVSSAEDIILNIMECGFRPGEASPEMGC